MDNDDDLESLMANARRLITEVNNDMQLLSPPPRQTESGTNTVSQRDLHIQRIVSLIDSCNATESLAPVEANDLIVLESEEVSSSNNRTSTRSEESLPDQQQQINQVQGYVGNSLRSITSPSMRFLVKRRHPPCKMSRQAGDSDLRRMARALRDSPQDDDVIFVGQNQEVIDLCTPVAGKRGKTKQLIQPNKNTNRKNLFDNPSNDISDKAGTSGKAVQDGERLHPVLMCAICMESSIQRKPTSTICGHIFCSVCIGQAILLTKKCPICNTKLSRKNVHRIYLN